MGICPSAHSQMRLCQDEQQRVNSNLSTWLRKEHEAQGSIIKLLLLGASEVGKSTLVKQMRILHCDGFSKNELLAQKNAIFSNLFGGIRNVVHCMRVHGIAFGDPTNVVNCLATLNKYNQFTAYSPYGDYFDGELAKAIQGIWSDPQVQAEVLERLAAYPLYESTKYILDNLSRICAPGYVPTLQDILMLRVKTTGIVPINFSLKEHIFNVIDVGGCRSERKKWMHCFDSVQCLIFVAALSEFDQMLEENDKTNRMVDSLQLFDLLCNQSYFFDKCFILFLNKKDLFVEKLAKGKSLKMVFKDYRGPEGPGSYCAQLNFIRHKFAALNNNPNKVIYMHETCATDGNQIKVVFAGVFDMLFQLKMKSSGLL